MKYLVKGFSLPVDAQEAGQELERIRQENQGLLKPQVVVDEARPDEAVLHPCFEWDDFTAGEEWRKHQARHLIKSVRVIKNEQVDETPKRAYVNIHKSEDSDRGYHALVDVVSDPKKRAQLVDMVWRELSAVKARYRELMQSIEDERLQKISLLITEKELEEAS